MIRQKIIECFKVTGGPEPMFESVLKELGLDRSQLVSQLNDEPPLNDLAGLTLGKASQVVEQFKGQAIFAPDIEKAIVEFNQARQEILNFEKRARDGESSEGK